MNRSKLSASLIAVALVAGGAAWADPSEDELVLNDETEMVTHTSAAPDYIPGLTEQYSGWRFRDPETRAMQLDDFDNPGMLGAENALEAFEAVEGSEGKACASCHEGPESLADARPTMPKFNEAKGEMYTMEMYINQCRTERMGAEAWDWNGDDMIEMTALLSSVARGKPMSVAVDGPAEPYWKKGEELYYTRFGQLELSCANCHEDHYGDYIRSDHLSQGQSNGFPVYRLKDAKLSGIHNRFRGCVRDTRAETYKIGSPEFIALELYVASRGNGLSVEGPSVRN